MRETRANRLGPIFESSEDAIVVAGPDGTIEDWNAAAERLYGHTDEEAIGRPLTFLIPGDRAQERAEIFEMALAGTPVRNFETVRVRKDGSPVEVSLSAWPIRGEGGRIEGVAAVAHDLSDVREAERRLRDREAQLSTAQEMAELGTWEWDVLTNEVTWTEQLYRIYGLEPGEFGASYEAYMERVHPADREHVAARINAALQTLEPFSFLERIVRPSGEVRTLQSRGRVVVDENGAAVRLIGVCQDVTRQVQDAERLRETAERLAEAQQIAHVGSWEWDIENDVVTWSDELHRIYGVAREEFENDYSAYLKYVHPDDRERSEQTVRRALERREGFEYEHRLVRRDGAVRVVLARGRAQTDENGRVVRMVGTAHDVTEQRQAQEQLARADAELELARRLQRVQRLTESALATLSLDELLPELAKRVDELLEVDNVAILVADEERAVLNQRVAVGIEEDAGAIRIPFGQGFAGRVAAEERTIAVEDDAHRQVVGQLLRERKVRSLLGAPLIAHGEVVGVLDVGSLRPRKFTDEEVRLLELAADRAALAVSHARLYERERQIAETLQRSLLPEQLPDVGGVVLAARYLPAAGGADVGGDWYDAIPLPDGRLGVAMGDVTGHGVGAAAMMGELRHALRAYAIEGIDPGEIAERLDKLIRLPGSERMATLLYMVLDPRSNRVEFVSAGHLPPLVVRPDRQPSFLTVTGGLPLGCGMGPYEPGTAEIEPGSLLVLYTDGLVERRSKGVDAGLEELAAMAPKIPFEPEAAADLILSTLLPEGPSLDDVAILTVRLVATAAERADVEAAPETGAAPLVQD
ncbi:MAG TPA: PAS domain-containing protein [Thermoleophilaceae bacterium]